MNIVVTRESFSTSSIPIVGGDPISDVDAESPGASNFYMPSTYDGASTSGTFSVKIAFGEVGAEQFLDPTSITSSAKTGLGLSVSTSATGFSISGVAGNFFTSSFYQFAMKDRSIKILPPNTTEDYYALVRYKMPFPTSILVPHTFTIGIPEDPIAATPATTGSVSINQWCLWNYAAVPGYIAQLSQQRT